jgi:peptide deformylase
LWKTFKGIFAMATLEIVKDGHPVLKKSAKRIKKMTDEMRTLADDMVETLKGANGVGLAANQVAQTHRMIIVMHAMDDLRVYVNPRITKFSDEEEYSDEGCLSFPMLYGNVGRAVEVTVCAQDLDMKKVKLKAEGFLARIFQHEIDHLNGITFTQRAEENSLRMLVPEEFTDEESAPEAESESKSEDAPIDDEAAAGETKPDNATNKTDSEEIGSADGQNN